MSLSVERLGQGPPVVLVHGSVSGAARSWRAQRPLAARWTLLLVDRPGFGASPPPPGGHVDFEADAPLVAETLGEGAHLVAHSYGGVAALLAAALRPDAVRSLTVVEPPAFGVAAGDPAVDRFVDDARELWTQGPADPREFLARFLELVGAGPLPDGRLPAEVEVGARLLQHERGPWEAAIPLAELAAAPFPKLVVSGAHDPAFDAVCDALEAGLGAERAVLPGAGHGVHRLGAPFNDALEAFLRRAEEAYRLQRQTVSPR